MFIKCLLGLLAFCEMCEDEQKKRYILTVFSIMQSTLEEEESQM